MSKKPFISIAIASYNYGKYLERGFEAIKRQKFDDFEIVYCDDSSVDNSVDIICSIIKKNPDINVRLLINKRNRGLIYTKNRLIDECKGRYLMLCDADDWMHDNCLSVLASEAKRTNAERIISEVYDIDEKGKVLQIQEFAIAQSKWLWNIHHGCLYRTDIIKNNNIKIFYEPDDVCFTTQFNQYTKNVTWVREPLYYWYVHEDSEGRKIESNHYKVIKEFENVLQHVEEVKCEEQEKHQLELLLLKVYYLQIYHATKKFSIWKQQKCYFDLNKVLKNYKPHYLDIKYICKREDYARKYAMRIIRMSLFLEKVHLMRAALLAYHFASKVIYFDQ